MFNSDAAVAALLSRNNVRDWAELNPSQTGLLLQQVERDNQAANLALAQIGLQEMGATQRNKDTIDWNKWQYKENQKQQRREKASNLLGNLSSLIGVGTAGRRLGVPPAQMGSVDPLALLQSVNAFAGGLTQIGSTSADYAPFLAQAAQYMPGLSSANRSRG